MSLLTDTRKKIKENGGILALNQIAEIDGNSIQRASKLEKIAIYEELKSEHPDWHNDQICAAMQSSISTMSRIRRDLGVKSSWRYDIPLNTKRNTTKWHCEKCNKDMLETSKESHLKSKTHINKSSVESESNTLRSKPTSSSKPKTTKQTKAEIGGNEEMTDEQLDEIIKNSCGGI